MSALLFWGHLAQGACTCLLLRLPSVRVMRATLPVAESQAMPQAQKRAIEQNSTQTTANKIGKSLRNF